MENVEAKEEPQETVSNMDSEKVDEESMDLKEESGVAEAAEENGLEEDDGDEDKWDAKCWDDATVNLSIKVHLLMKRPTLSLNER